MAFIGRVFWAQDAKYSLPTPKPAGLFQPPIGSTVALAPALERIWQDKPAEFLFVHTYNPFCPCSRFNLDHVESLVESHHDKVTFVALIQGNPSEKVMTSLRGKLEGMTLIEDRDGRFAAQFGVYSTPQAVILDGRHSIQFRGNYNLSRYCNNPETEFARVALESLLLGKIPPAETNSNLAYGCALLKKKQGPLSEVLETGSF